MESRILVKDKNSNAGNSMGWSERFFLGHRNETMKSRSSFVLI